MGKLISQYTFDSNNEKREESEVIRLEKAKQARAEKTARNKKLFLELFQKVMIVSAVIEKMEITRAAYYDWIHDDPDFKNAVLKIEGERHADVEDRLFKKIKQDDGPSIRFYLERREPRYKIKSINEIGPTGFKSLEELIADEEKKRDEQIAEQIRKSEQQRNNREAIQDTGQEGADSEVQIQPSPGLLLETKDTPKPDTESEARGVEQGN